VTHRTQELSHLNDEVADRVLTIFDRQNALIASLLEGGDALVGLVPEAVALAATGPSNGGGPVAEPAVAEPGTGGSEPTPDPGLSRDDVRAKVVAVLSEKSGYAPSELSDGMELGPELGLDSLMLGNVVVSLSHEFTEWDVREVVPGDLRTLGDLVDSVAGADVPQAAAPAAPPAPAPAPAATPGSSAGPGNEPKPVEDRTPIDQLAEATELLERLDHPPIEVSRSPYYIGHAGNVADQTVIDGRSYISFSSYNYLGLTAHPVVQAAATDAVAQYGTSVSSARILSGNRPIHDQLEQAIAALVGAQDAVTLVGGHSTNTSIIPHLYGEKDIIFYDSLVHDSIQQGIKASGAVRHAYGHNDLAVLKAGLTARRHRFRRALIVTEGLFSMDGDIPPLADLVELKSAFGAHLMVDEAHSIGVLGPRGGGICDETGVSPDDVDILMGTLSKSLASCGGYIAGHREFIRYLQYSLSAVVFSAGMTPANTASALAAAAVLSAEPDRLERLRDNATHFLDGARQRGMNVGPAIGAAVVPVILGDSMVAVRVADELFQRGISVNPIIFPAVPESLARLRFFITADHTHDQLDTALDATAQVVQDVLGHVPATVGGV